MTTVSETADDWSLTPGTTGEQMELLSSYLEYQPHLERSGGRISGGFVRARSLIDSVLRSTPLSKPDNLEKWLQTTEKTDMARRLGRLREQLQTEIDEFIAETDAMDLQPGERVRDVSSDGPDHGPKSLDVILGDEQRQEAV